jgi:hypothetical protein
VREQNNDQITGQYVQKELILDIASWISPDFYSKWFQLVVDKFTGAMLVEKTSLIGKIGKIF